ncbi:MAG: hypothetical protein CL814_05810 [Confluentimicrobium sp.]|nr:hypothetical protein [Actibacterium sp.]
MGTQSRQVNIATVAGVMLLAGWAVLTVMGHWNIWMRDLSAVYMAARLYAEGQAGLIYAAPEGFFGGTPAAWTDTLAALGVADQDALPYIYPPLWAALLAPLAGTLGPYAFFNLATTVQVPLIALSSVLAWRILRPAALPFWQWSVVTVILLKSSLIAGFALILMQPQITVIFLILLAFERYRAGAFVLAGAVLGLAAMLKLAPAGLVLIFVLDRRWRALAGLAAACALIGLAGLAVAGPALHLEFLHSLGRIGAGLFITPVNFSVPALIHTAGALAGLLPPIDPAAHNIRIPAVPPAVGVISKLLLLGGIALLIRATAGLPDATRLPTRLFALSLLLNLFGPVSWAHYFLLQLLLLPGLFGLLPARRAIPLTLLIGAAGSNAAFGFIRASFPGDIPFMALNTGVMLLLFAGLLIPTRRAPTPCATVPA